MSCDEGHEERRRTLTAEHGAPKRFDNAEALRLLGERGRVHPRDVIAFAYRDRAAADAWAASNWDHFRHPSLGACPVEGLGVVGAYDLRPMLAAHRCELTDPALPDNWAPPPRSARSAAGSAAG